MIPPDVASRLQVSADAALRPVPPAQEISDKLSGLVAGQKVLAEIQSVLPNGTYRAVINQRNITLALPFSAKSGDSLELQVTENDGKLALAILSRTAGSSIGGHVTESVSATLSRAGQLISELFSGSPSSSLPRQNGTTAVTLNGNQPIASAPPNSAQDILPLLKQAITQSGMFYESHQAEWVEGRLPKMALLNEPQGKLSAPANFATLQSDEPRANADSKIQPSPLSKTPDTGTTQSLQVDVSKAQSTSAGTQLVAPQTQPLVQQQLEALATQNFSWQGQVWPGQEMRWEIDEDTSRHAQEGDDDPAERWTTRLHLTLPNLGDVTAQIRLKGNQITLALDSNSAVTRTLMRRSGTALLGQLNEAGLTLIALGIGAAADGETDDQTF